MPFSPFHKINVASLSDWAEFNAICGQQDISKSLLEKRLERDDEPAEEETLDSVFAELERRKNLYGNDSPFSISSQTISPLRSWESFPEYILCLYFSLYGAKNQHNETKLFELISAEAVKNYLQGESIVIGFPRDRSFKDTVQELSKNLYERRGGWEVDAYAKDSGLDIVAWKAFGDKRAGQVVLLLQCGAGYHWKNKKPVPKIVWQNYISWSSTFLTGMVMPIIINEDKWTYFCGIYELLFDRARLFRLWQQSTINTDVRASVLKWCKEAIPNVMGDAL